MDQKRTSSIVENLRLTFIDNPMLDESRRAQRKFFPKGRIGVIIGFVLFWIFYIWICIEAFLLNSDLTMACTYTELVILTLILPASIYNAVSGERERGTWEALVLTRLTVGQIVFGKLIWRLRIIFTIWVLLMIPILISRMNINSNEIGTNMLVLGQTTVLSWSLLMASFGLWVSSITRKSITSLATIALVLICTLIAVPTLYAMFVSALNLDPKGIDHDTFFTLITEINPFVCVNNALSAVDQSGGAVFLHPPGVTETLDNTLVWRSRQFILNPPGLSETLIYLIFTAVFTVFSIERLKRLEQPIRGAR